MSEHPSNQILPSPRDRGPEPGTPESVYSEVFIQLITQTSSMALMFLGEIEEPDTGKRYSDLRSAKAYIDQLEAIRFKTSGNLTSREKELLELSLKRLHRLFADAMEGQAASSAE